MPYQVRNQTSEDPSPTIQNFWEVPFLCQRCEVRWHASIRSIVMVPALSNA